jgi:hypothetical protein
VTCSTLEAKSHELEHSSLSCVASMLLQADLYVFELHGLVSRNQFYLLCGSAALFYYPMAISIGIRSMVCDAWTWSISIPLLVRISATVESTAHARMQDR